LNNTRSLEKTDGQLPLVSVIICTYNRAQQLERTLRALSLQSFAPEMYEVIIVNDGSDDTTQDVGDAWSKHILRMKYMANTHNKGGSFSANRGVQSSLGEHILFTDDDCIPDEDWIKQMSQNLEKYPIVAGSINSSRSHFFRLCHNISQFHPFMPGHNRKKIDFIAGANMGFRRTDLMKLGKFRGSMAQDTDMILRAREKGYEIRFVKEAIVLHDPERDAFSDIFQYSKNHASATILLRLKYKKLLHTPSAFKSPIFLVLFSPFIAFIVTTLLYFRNRKLLSLFWTAPVVFVLKCAWCWGAARELRERKDKIK
jgi:GT2 family glycosyltransferase